MPKEKIIEEKLREFDEGSSLGEILSSLYDQAQEEERKRIEEKIVPLRDGTGNSDTSGDDGNAYVVGYDQAIDEILSIIRNKEDK